MANLAQKKSALPKLACALLGLGAFPSLTQQTAIPPELIKRIQPATVSIVTLDANSADSSRGSGFFIGENLIITCKHVYGGASRSKVRLAGDRFYPIQRVLAEDKESDLIVLEVERPSPPIQPLALAKTLPNVGEIVYLSFCPSGLDPAIDQSLVSAYQRDVPKFAGLDLMQFSSAVYQSCSGGPILNQQGQVVGVIDARLKSQFGENINFAIPLSRLTDLIAPVLFENISYALGIALLYVVREPNYEEARNNFKKVVEQDSSHGEAWFYIAYCHYKLGEKAEALEACKKVLTLRPDEVEAYMISAWAYQQYGEQIEMYKRALELKPDYAEAYFRLGLVYRDAGKYPKAQEAMNEAVRLEPEYAKAHYHLGTIYLLQDDEESAQEEYEILQKLDADLAKQLLRAIEAFKRAKK